jgi:UDP-GlcNAc:undecaprenyl-phosphate/decaprenyl-phosphate GlcNAc-1-phosphate transferase
MILLQIFLLTLFSYILVKIVIKYAHELRFLDIPNERSHHCDIIPSGAGLGFISAFFIMITLFEFELLLTNWYYFLSIFVVFIIGIIDDRFEVSARWKFIVIFFSVFILWLNGVSIDTLGIWFGYDLSFSWWIALPFSMFAIAGFTNALNLIDGIDGLSSSVSLVILFFFLFLGIEYHDNFIIKISLYTIATLIGFIILNWHPAKIFMGDSGSLTLGFIISVLALKSIEHIHPIGILYLAAIPLLDTLVVMVRRIRRGKSPFKPDKTHIHHILVKFFDMNVKKKQFYF